MKQRYEKALEHWLTNIRATKGRLTERAPVTPQQKHKIRVLAASLDVQLNQAIEIAVTYALNNLDQLTEQKGG